MFRDFFGNIPPVSKNLLLLNLLMFVFILTGGQTQGGFVHNFTMGLYYFGSPEFKPFQIVTHLFSHGSFLHLAFNMLALVMFGSVLERMWGGRRFLIFYLITGLGAVVLHEAVSAWQVYHITGEFYPSLSIEGTFTGERQLWMNDINEATRVYSTMFTPAVGASGAIFGLLIGFAMLFPNTELMFLFLPVPIKAKYLVPIFIVVELVLGVGNFEFDNVAHFAHLGGALFGFILVKLWQRNRSNFY